MFALPKQSLLFVALLCCPGLICSPWLSSPTAAQITLIGDHNPAYNGIDNPWNFVNNFFVGINSDGTMRIEGGYVVDNDSWGHLGYFNGVHGEALVTGGGSVWDCFRILYVGFGGSGLLDIENGGRVVSGGGRIGEGGAAVGEVEISGVGSRWDTSGLEVGYNGQGTLEIGAGGVVSSTSATFLGRNSNSDGTVLVSGAGSQFINSTTLFLGYLGDGDMRVENGGYLENREGTVGTGNGTMTMVTITGNNSQWINLQNLSIGFNGDVMVSIDDGGYVSTAWDAFIARNSLHTSSVTVTGQGSQWDIGRNLFVGGREFQSGGTGTLDIGLGGIVTVADDLKIWNDGTLINNGTLTCEGTVTNDGSYQGAGTLMAPLNDNGVMAPGNSAGVLTLDGDYNKTGGSVEIELGGIFDGGGDNTLAEYDRLHVTGNVTLTGSLNVQLIDGFEITTGMSFEIINVDGTFTGGFNGLGEGALVGNFGGTDLFISYLGGDGNDVVLFTPEPSVILGDVNLDGIVNLLDVDFFIDRLGTGTYQIEADCNEDGMINLLDIDPFIAILGGG